MKNVNVVHNQQQDKNEQKMKPFKHRKIKPEKHYCRLRSDNGIL